MSEKVDKYARRIIELQAEQAEIAEAIENYKERLATEVGGEGEVIVGSNETGFVKIITYKHKAFNEAYGKKKRPDLFEALAVDKKVLDSATFKAAIADGRATDEDYAEFQKPSDKGLSVKLEVLNDE